ncbi:uncharacterized protein At1g26090, chloroplastic isoform X2 [Vitis vinifera]|uniref:uncharacterized protein At1g26090, chloroplastic isoform X2 n=1 Tax=Vitis vinifera TaxID=29760 RepID=UPI0008FECC21|nr:uncharacterized protein At1g26090, chloroplastic isoform X2 [Vitis vinifera]|eukprot:XP_019072729.1 PREDICTED: uncharacterized protein At1g26090, chloroplastic isoform X2 [Vitis vinifera]
MASSPLLLSSALSRNPNSGLSIRRRRHGALATTASSEEDHSTKLVTFLGKGGSGKTTSAIFAAQVVGEELGVLPGMDSVFTLLALERLVGFLGNLGRRNLRKDKYDIIIYDGINTEETLRMIGVTSRARLYLKYLRNMAERTDIGRLAGPSLLRLVDEAMSLSTRGSNLNGKMSSEIWDILERALERGSSAFGEPREFGCYLVVDPNNPASVSSALRYWGCAIQAGAQVSGAFGTASPHSDVESEEIVKNFSPLPFALCPHVPMGSLPDWNAIISSNPSEDARNLLSAPASSSSNVMEPVKFDPSKKSVSLLMPGFDKSEIKLYQYRGGSELLVEAGDQRRVIRLPPEIQGKVGGAKFADRKLVITMR